MYDLSVCLTLSPELQRRRILARNGEAMAQRFFERWIPLEQAYFDAMKPQTRCGFLIEAISFPTKRRCKRRRSRAHIRPPPSAFIRLNPFSSSDNAFTLARRHPKAA